MKVLAAMIFTMGISMAAMAQSVVVDVVLNPMGDFKAKSSAVKGRAVVKGGEVLAENIVVDLKTLKTGVELRDRHTQKYLETDKFPEALLISAKGKGGKGTGKINIRGIEKDVSGVYKVEGGLLKAKFKLKLSDFGIEDISYMGVGVEDEVTLSVIVPIKS